MSHFIINPVSIGQVNVSCNPNNSIFINISSIKLHNKDWYLYFVVCKLVWVINNLYIVHTIISYAVVTGILVQGKFFGKQNLHLLNRQVCHKRKLDHLRWYYIQHSLWFNFTRTNKLDQPLYSMSNYFYSNLMGVVC